MTRKSLILAIIAFSAILPMAAVADIMISDHSISSFNNEATSYAIQPGPGYASANSLDTIVMTSSNNGQSGSIILGGNQHYYTYMTNVIDLNITGTANADTFYLNLSMSEFPPGTLMVVSTYQIGFGEMQELSVTHYKGIDIPLPVKYTVNKETGSKQVQNSSVMVDMSENPNIAVTGFYPGETMYISFILPPNLYTGMSAELSGS